MPTKYVIRVPFAPVRYTQIGQSVTGALKVPVVFNDCVIRQAGEAPGYDAEVLLTETHPHAAMRKATINVERILQVLAINNNGFNIDYFGVSVVSSEQVGPIQAEYAFATESLSVLKTSANLDTERSWLTHWSDLPMRVIDGLEMHYLAMQAANLHTRFVVLMGALERLASNSRPSTIASRIAPDVRRALTKAMNAVLANESFGLTQTEVTRIVTRALDTQSGSVSTGLFNYLTAVQAGEALEASGATFGQELVAGWWRIRGRSAHGLSEGDLLSDVNRLSVAVQTALRYEFTTASAELEQSNAIRSGLAESASRE